MKLTIRKNSTRRTHHRLQGSCLNTHNRTLETQSLTRPTPNTALHLHCPNLASACTYINVLLLTPPFTSSITTHHHSCHSTPLKTHSLIFLRFSKHAVCYPLPSKSYATRVIHCAPFLHSCTEHLAPFTPAPDLQNTNHLLLLTPH